MNDIKDYLEDKISVIKFNLNMELEYFYNERGIKDFTYPFEMIEIMKKEFVDGIDPMKITQMGYKYLIRNFESQQDETTEYFFYKMLVNIALCEFYLERENITSAISHLGSFYFFKGVNESKNEKSIQRIQMSDNGSKKGKMNSQCVQEIIKEMLISKVWVTREDFYNKVYDRACELGIERSRKSIVRDFASAVKELENYQQYFEHKGKK